MYAGLETAETVYTQRPLLPDNVDRNQLSAVLADRKKAVMDEMMPLLETVGKTDAEEARMVQLNAEITAISNVQETLSQGYDPIHYLDGMISLRTRTDGPDGAEAYKAPSGRPTGPHRCHDSDPAVSRGCRHVGCRPHPI